MSRVELINPNQNEERAEKTGRKSPFAKISLKPIAEISEKGLDEKKSGIEIKKDFFDFKYFKNKKIYNWGIYSAGMMVSGSTVIALLLKLPYRQISLDLISELSAFTLFNICNAVDAIINDEADKNTRFKDSELGYKAMQLVYQNKGDLKIGERKLRKKDNFLYIRLPELKNKTDVLPLKKQVLSVEENSAWSDIQNLSLQDIRERSKNRGYKGVAIEISSDTSPVPNSLNSENAPVVKKKQLFEGKGIELRDPYKKCVFLSREEFEAFAKSPYEIFQKGAKSLADPVFLHYLSLFPKTENIDEKKKLKDMLEKRLDSILKKEVEINFNGPEAKHERKGDFAYPVKTKVFPFSDVRKNDNGYFFIQTFTTNGEIRAIPLEKLLKIESQPIETILDSQSPYKKAQVAYVLHKMLKEHSLEELLKNKELQKEDVLRRIGEFGLEIQKMPEAYDNDVKFGLFPKKFSEKIRPFLNVLFLSAVLNFGVPVMAQRDQLKEILPKPHASEQQHKVELSTSLPFQGLEWKLEGNINPDNYYILNTSGKFENGQWAQNKEIKENIELPESIDENKNQLHVLKTLEINRFDETRFKIPMGWATEISALKIQDQDGKRPDFVVNKLIDGTIEVVIEKGVFDSPAYIDIDATFTPTSILRVRATEKIDPIDQSKLNEKAKEEIEKALEESETMEVKDFPLALAKNVGDSYTYSLNPNGAEKFADLNTPEDYINAVADLSSCYCETCNTATVLLSSLSEESATNIATGFLSVNNHPAGKGDGFLRTETAHAFGISEYGSILDSTARNISDDPLTQEYVRMLGFSPENSDQEPDGKTEEESKWEKQKNSISEKAKSKKELFDNLIKLGALFTAFGGAFALNKTIPFVKRKAKEIDREKALDNLVSKGLSENDLEKALKFFSWMSFGNPQKPVDLSITASESLSKEEILKKIKENTDMEKVKKYIQQPAGVEERFVLPKTDVIKLRLLANYLLSS